MKDKNHFNTSSRHRIIPALEKHKNPDNNNIMIINHVIHANHDEEWIDTGKQNIKTKIL